MRRVAIIVAGGSGKRMHSEVPKQFLEIGGLPILMHTLSAFTLFDSQMKIILVLPQDQFGTWERLCIEHKFHPECALVPGGEKRFHSVKNGLEGMPDDCLVAVHDGVRPFVSQDTLTRCFKEGEMQGAVIPVIEIGESIRKLEGEDSTAVERSAYRLVQTPQLFHSNILKDAYKTDYEEHFTDDASVVEAAGYKVFMTQGNPENIKITSPYDLKIAEALL